MSRKPPKLVMTPEQAQKRLRLARLAALCSAGGIIIALLGWYLRPSTGPNQTVAWINLALLLPPILLALPGLLRGKLYTYRWVSMVCLLYFTHGAVETWTAGGRWAPAWMEVLLAFTLFCATLVYVKAWNQLLVHQQQAN